MAKLWEAVSATSEAGSGSGEHSGERAEGRASPSDARDAESDRTLPEYDPSTLHSRRHFVTEIGIPADEFFSRLIEEQGGTLPQKRFTEFTNLSSSTICRILQEMEEDGQVVRVRIGRENIVCLPDHAPSDGITPIDDTDGRLRV